MPHLIYATAAYAYFADELTRLLDAEAGVVERATFPDGEHYHRLHTSARGRHVVLVGGTVGDAATLELYDLAATLIQMQPAALTLVVPYYGYSTMERPVRPGEVVKARTRAQLISAALPPCGAARQVLLLDLHAEGIPYYFDGHVSVAHLYAKAVILAAARRLGGEDFVLAATDAGRAKWVASLGRDLNVPTAFVYKQRLTGADTRLTGVNAQVEGRTVVLYDDMIRTGGSLLQAAEAYLNHGAKAVHALSTHLVLPEGALERLRNSGLLRGVTGTDSHPRGPALADDFLEVVSVAPVFADYLRAGPVW